MEEDVTLDQLRHEAVQRAAGGGHELEDLGAPVLLLDGALERLDLSTDTPDAADQLLFILGGVRHRLPPFYYTHV